MLSPADLRTPLPHDWEVMIGGDTGTYMSAVIMAFRPQPYAAFVLDEFPNYRYVANEPELLGLTLAQWSAPIVARVKQYRPRFDHVKVWADPNTQFRTELQHYGLYLIPNKRKLELRVEIAREYQQGTGVCWFAPWLTVLPYEMEYAKWPDEHTTAGKYERIKQFDHTLDCFEHVCSRRPRTKRVLQSKRETFLERFKREHGIQKRTAVGDPHLGRL